ncbi:TolC family protein [Hymenobacter yonginensis]|uniref:TolC family protein n=1 Tax=Hymenobacter yonginensis TaxID=748197 RepID=A0ABY7PUV1_9BACT|nr:TolC family protein [Hymenobacter yonginensis]WBO86686.1 TolC family protein [Hymenobacter yonginensis]
MNKALLLLLLPLLLAASRPAAAQVSAAVPSGGRGAGQPASAAQSASAAPLAPRAAWEARFFDAPELTLPVLVEAAVRRSAELKALGAERAMVREDLQMARKAILGSVLLTNSIGYGNIANVALADQSVAAVRTANSARHYATGLNFNLPLDRLLNRPHQIARQKLQGQRFEHLEQAQRDAIRQHVIDLYQAVLLAHRVLMLRQQSYVNAQLNAQLVEKQFRTGEATLADLALLQDRFINASIDRESAASSYTTALLQLEEAAGARVADLLAQP